MKFHPFTLFALLTVVFHLNFGSAAEGNVLNVEDSHRKIDQAIRTELNKPEGALNDRDLNAVRYLNLSGLGLSDIGPLNKLASLHELMLSDNHVSDLSPLAELPITKLAFHNNLVKDISPLKTMKRLSIIYFRNNRVTDLSPLFELPFKRAVVSGNPLQDVTLPEKLKRKVRYKHLTPQGSVAAIEKAIRERIRKPTGELSQGDYDKITQINLGGMGLSDISPLSKCQNLTSLNLHMNEVTDVSPLAGLNKLTTLDLGSNMIEDISPLKDLVKLTTLIIYINHIEDIAVVANMRDLNFLSAYENNIKVVKHVHHMKTARRIKFHDNPVPVEAQETCHRHLPDVELFFKTGSTKNYYVLKKN